MSIPRANKRGVAGISVRHGNGDSTNHLHHHRCVIVDRPIRGTAIASLTVRAFWNIRQCTNLTHRRCLKVGSAGSNTPDVDLCRIPWRIRCHLKYSTIRELPSSRYMRGKEDCRSHYFEGYDDVIAGNPERSVVVSRVIRDHPSVVSHLVRVD